MNKIFHAEIKQLRTGEVESFNFEAKTDENAKDIINILYGNRKVWEVIKLGEVVFIYNSNPIVRIKVIEETFLN